VTARPQVTPVPAASYDAPLRNPAPGRNPAPVPGAGGNLIPLKENSPAPVRGTVKATQPTLRPDQYVQPLSPSVVATFLQPAGAEAFAQAVPEPATLSAADWSRNWPKIVDEVRKEKIAIGHLLAETSFHAANGASVCIACPDDFHADLLKRNRQYISQLAERIYGARVQFESILAAAPAAGDDDRPGDGFQTDGGRSSGGRAADAMKDNPLVQALVREFGAEEIH
jgi:hypothetical protein